jgi:hypothetical protein
MEFQNHIMLRCEVYRLALLGLSREEIRRFVRVSDKEFRDICETSFVRAHKLSETRVRQSLYNATYLKNIA